ncbi:MAG: hypothetical protein ACLFPA_09575 [Dichotomicrobium sp.]
MNNHRLRADAPRGGGLYQLGRAERLTGFGFRCWLAGYQNGTIDCWEQAWNAYALELGPHAARHAIRDLSCWVRSVSGHARRGIALCPAACTQFGYDECLAVSMIAAAQHKCPGVKACAFALLGCEQFDEVIASATQFAAVLRENSLVLGHSPIVEPLAQNTDGTDGRVH